MSECARCNTRVCAAGDQEHGPENCPMRGDFPAPNDLYASPEVREVARVAAIVESTGHRRWTRAEEIMEFAKMLGFSRLGVVSCGDMSAVAGLYVEVLQANGFEAVVAGHSGEECDPAAMAERCSERKTQLNVLLGMHVGHDSIFIRCSKALVTSLVARDQVLVHNPVGAIYGAGGYFSQGLRRHRVAPVTGPVVAVSDVPLPSAAEEVINQGRGRWTRLEETMELAHRLGVTRLGLIFCNGLRNEAATVTDVLEANGFQVVSSMCKTGAVPKEYMGVLDSEKVRPGRPEMMCNPLAQAEILNRSDTGLNILMGQCVGHDSLSMRHSTAPVVCLVAKDRMLAHNTVAALYESRGMLRPALSEHRIR